MAYSCYIVVCIRSVNTTLNIQKASLNYGKFYEKDNKDKELLPETIDQIEIRPEEKRYICSCGRSSSATGTTGSFEIFDNELKLATLNWMVPFSGTSELKLSVDEEINKDYYIGISGDIKQNQEIKIICINRENL